jgi:hypothetical protein
MFTKSSKFLAKSDSMRTDDEGLQDYISLTLLRGMRPLELHLGAQTCDLVLDPRRVIVISMPRLSPGSTTIGEKWCVPCRNAHALARIILATCYFRDFCCSSARMGNLLFQTPPSGTAGQRVIAPDQKFKRSDHCTASRSQKMLLYRDCRRNKIDPQAWYNNAHMPCS